MGGFTGDKAEFGPTGVATPYPGVSSRVRAILDLYGPTNQLTRQELFADGTPTGKYRAAGPAKIFGTADPAAPVCRTAPPVTHVSKACPPVLILHGRIDTTVDRAQSEELARALQQSGVVHELVMVEASRAVSAALGFASHAVRDGRGLRGTRASYGVAGSSRLIASASLHNGSSATDG